MPTSYLMPSNNNNSIELPIPADTTTLQYTKLEAALILSGTKKGSNTRGNMMTKMICLGYVPTTKRSLQRLLQRMAKGEVIGDDESWGGDAGNTPQRQCLGIKSSTFDKFAMDNIMYCFDAGWFIDPTQQWCSMGCSNENVDKCGRCKSATVNIATSIVNAILGYSRSKMCHH